MPASRGLLARCLVGKTGQAPSAGRTIAAPFTGKETTVRRLSLDRIATTTLVALLAALVAWTAARQTPRAQAAPPDMQALIFRLREAGLDYDAAWVCPSSRHQGGLYLKEPGDHRSFDELAATPRWGSPERLAGIAILVPARGRMESGPDCCCQVGPWLVHARPEEADRIRRALGHQGPPPSPPHPEQRRANRDDL
jgi:hypothetical protein